MIESTVLEKFAKYNLRYSHLAHSIAAQNIANASKPGYITKALSAPESYKSFQDIYSENHVAKSLEPKVYLDDSLPFKLNRNNVDDTKEYQKIVSNVNDINLWQNVLQSLYECNFIVSGIK